MNNKKHEQNYHHPYQPYDIQVQLMDCVYEMLSKNIKIGILESPTGTGKTLSLICSTLTWLRDNKLDYLKRHKDDITIEEDSSTSEEDSEPDWVNEAYQSSYLKEKINAIKDYELYLDEVAKDELILNPISNMNPSNPTKRRKRTPPKHIQVNIEEDELLPDPYDSDIEEGFTSSDSKSILNTQVKALLAKLEVDHKSSSTSHTDDLLGDISINPIKIYFSSRTHSQLNQFASQLRLPQFHSSFKSEIEKEHIKYLPLGSKKQLCINPEAKKWKTLESINDACSELRKTKAGCPYFGKQTDPSVTTVFRDRLFSRILDIEDLVPLGEELSLCPYYGSRNSQTIAEVITLPYQYLLSESTRQSMGLNLSNSIVIIDEAHNLIDTITNVNSAEVSLDELKECKTGLGHYMNKFKSRLNSGNRVNITKLTLLISTLISFIEKNYSKAGQKVFVDDIFQGSNADKLNIHKLTRYIRISKIAYKIDTYLSKLQEKSVSPTNADMDIEQPLNVSRQTRAVNKSSQPVLFRVSSFIAALANVSGEGEFFFEKGNKIKYLLLEPSNVFQKLVDESKCIILAGGTMQPMQDFHDALVPLMPDDSIKTFSCDHVIPKDYSRTYIVKDDEYEFTFEKRESEDLIKNHLYKFLSMLSRTVPDQGGIVAFFPSYQYLKKVIAIWKKHRLFDDFNARRKLLYEEKDTSDPLPEYIALINDGKAATLFAVVGGKLSEGINFQDNLCRAVVMVGLPYPNVFSGEVILKKNHLIEKTLKKGGSTNDASIVTRNFFDNLCMKAVNQSVGRSIRHASDYANIYLLDKRYGNDNIQGKLSQWIRNGIQKAHTTNAIMADSEEFFKLRGANPQVQ